MTDYTNAPARIALTACADGVAMAFGEVAFGYDSVLVVSAETATHMAETLEQCAHMAGKLHDEGE